jgi:hypothetical protein
MSYEAISLVPDKSFLFVPVIGPDSDSLSRELRGSFLVCFFNTIHQFHFLSFQGVLESNSD